MSYSKIRNPETNRNVNINSRLGKMILRKYIDQIGGARVGAHDEDKDAWIFKRIANEKIHLRKSDGPDDRPAIMHLINHESGYARNEIGSRVFDKVKGRTKEIAKKESSKTEDHDKEELDKTMFLYGYPTSILIYLIRLLYLE